MICFDEIGKVFCSSTVFVTAAGDNVISAGIDWNGA